jgi:hypothetical protein
MIRYQDVLCGVSQYGVLITIYPQSEKLIVYKNMFEIEMKEDDDMPRLYRHYKEGCKLHINMNAHYEASPNEEWQHFRNIEITLSKDGKHVPGTFRGNTYPTGFTATDYNEWNEVQDERYVDTLNPKWKKLQRWMKGNYHLLQYKKPRRLALAMALHHRLGPALTPLKPWTIKCLSCDVLARLI